MFVFSRLRQGFSGPLIGAAFLMATSAIGPGFITQTTVFTRDYGASFGCVILVSILLDIGIQLNIWRVVTAGGRYAQELADAVLPGLGAVLTLLVALGGLVFNIGNIAGCGLGIQTLFGWDLRAGCIGSAAVAIALFLVKDAGKAMDVFTKWLGLGMIALTLLAAYWAQPPLGEVAYRTFFPEQVSEFALLTIVGGTVGGYISFAGAHRLLAAGIQGPEQVGAVSGHAVRGIVLASVMRIVLFLAALGVVTQGVALDAGNPALSVFTTAAGHWGRVFFGIVLWSAAITSVVGASYTSVSFLQSLHPVFVRRTSAAIVGYIVLATVLFLLVGKPVKVLVWAGALNGFILPVALAAMLLAARLPELQARYRHPRWLSIAGWIIVALMGYFGIKNIILQLNM